MTLPSRHRIRNSSSDRLRPSPLLLGHGGSPQYGIFTSERGVNIFFFETWMPERSSNPRSPTFQAGSFSHCTRALSFYHTRAVLCYFPSVSAFSNDHAFLFKLCESVPDLTPNTDSGQVCPRHWPNILKYLDVVTNAVWTLGYIPCSKQRR